MGLGRLMHRNAPREHMRTITEFAIVDGVKVDGSGQWGNRYGGAMSIPGAWRASILLSDLLGAVPWYGYRTEGDVPVEQMVPTPPLVRQPNPQETRMNTFSSLGLDLIYHGNAIGILTAFNRDGWPTALLGVPANQVGVRRIVDNALSPLPVGAIEYRCGGLTFAEWQVLHIKGPCEPGALRGMGVLEAHLSGVLELAREQIRQAQSISRHGVPTGILTTENPNTTPKQLQDAKEGWLKAQRERTVAALNSVTKFIPISWNPDDLEMVEARKLSNTDMEMLFGLPVGWLGGQQDSKSYRTRESDAIDLIKFSLGGHLARFEQTISMHMPPDEVAQADLDSLSRADIEQRFAAYKIGIEMGIIDAEEARAEEGRGRRPRRRDPIQVKAVVGRPDLPAIEGTAL